MTREPVRIANASGFYGDRMEAMKELIEGGPIDVLTGDWLAELTMLILVRDRMRSADRGYARTFLKQLSSVLLPCLDAGTRVVSNAGGTNPHALAKAVRELASELGREVSVAVVDGDDITAQLGDLQTAGHLAHLDTEEPLTPAQGMPLAGHAYLGAGGIAEALRRGAQIVITGRTTDAAAVVGPAMWWHGWTEDAWDALAGALVAGHVIECGAQGSGGNYAFHEEVPSLRRVGFPIAEIASDGGAVITKHPGTDGLVSTGTVTAQLLYEIGGPQYYSPDVIARFDTVRLTDLGSDRVRIHGTRGEPPTATLKAGVLLAAGWRNQVRVIIGGGQPEAKAARFSDAFWAAVGGEDAFARTQDELLRGDHPDAPPHLRLSRLTLSAADPDRDKLGRVFTGKAIELALANVPGITLDGLPGDPMPCGVFWPCLIPRDLVGHKVHTDDDTFDIPHPPLSPEAPPIPTAQPPAAEVPFGRSVRVPLGRLVGARSGDKAGNANVGFWVRKPGHWSWLHNTLTPERIRGWLGGFSGPIHVHPLPNLLAVNIELVGWLGMGVGANLSTDSQAKALAECLRSVEVDVDAALLADDA